MRVHPFENLEIMLVCLENDFPQLDEVLDKFLSDSLVKIRVLVIKRIQESKKFPLEIDSKHYPMVVETCGEEQRI